MWAQGETHDEDTFAPDDYGRLLWPWHLPHARYLVLQGREAHGETNLACDRQSRDRLRRRQHANLPSAYFPSFYRRGLHFLR